MQPARFILDVAVLVTAWLAPSIASAGSVALVLDASGSMNARLPEGKTRIEAAKAAVADLVVKLPAETRLALWAYGHQSPTRKHDCHDIERVVGFDAVGTNKDTVLTKTRAIAARGYTPITSMIKLVADDLGKEEAKPRTLILVSDGKETCEGDPCAAAKALADADASLVVHTIGFAVDTTARLQLQCIARVARGRYFDAGSTGELAATLGEAAKPPPPLQQVKQIVVTAPKPGQIEVRHADMIGHKVSAADSGQLVASLNSSGPRKELPAGLYNVTFGKTVWKSVEVKPGETTVLDPGVLEVRNPNISGHKVLDAETGEELGKIVSSSPRMTVLPSTFSVQFGETLWKDIEVKPGEVKVLNPGLVEVRGLSAKGPSSARVLDEDGTLAARMNSSSPRAALPPGKYVLEVPGQRVSFQLAEGTKVELKLDQSSR